MRRPAPAQSGFVGPLIAVTLIFTVVYFGHHAIWGARGLHAQQSIEAETERLLASLGEVRGERQYWDRRVYLLKAEHIDPDMLDERARAELWMAQPGEIIIPLKSQRNTSPQ